MKSWTLGFAILVTASSTAASGIGDAPAGDPASSRQVNPAIAWKATLGYYIGTSSGSAHDLNVRGNTEDWTAWLGHYVDRQGFAQTRLGMETSLNLPLGRVIPSVQIASGGFVGGSITWDGRADPRKGIGPIVGVSRTNLRPYMNLNFDPNDSLIFGASYAAPPVGVLSLYQIRDDRLDTGQRVTHLVWRRNLAKEQRLTVDLFSRSGAEAAGAVVYRGLGGTVTVDIGDYFFRVGYDAHANYTQEGITRIAAGFRF